MKKMKKFASLMLALIMVLSLTVTAFAAEEKSIPTGEGTITIDNAVSGQTYTLYQILELESYDKTAGAYSYKIAEGWKNFITSSDIKDVYVKVDTNDYVTWIPGASVEADAAAAAELAKKAKEYAAANSSALPKKVKQADSKKVVFDKLELGYYLVESTYGTLCSLDTTDPTVTMAEKNDVPSNTKEVKEGDTYGFVNDAEIGQKVLFRNTIVLPPGAVNLVFHDKMSGMALSTTAPDKVAVYTDPEMKSELANTNYEVKTSGLNDTDCTFEVVFKQAYLDTLTANTTTLYIGYSATVSAGATVGGNGNKNTSYLTYGSDSTNPVTTPEKSTYTYTWGFDIFKCTVKDDADTPLKDAQFVLIKKDGADGDKVAAITSDGKFDGWMPVPTTGNDWDPGCVMTTGANGMFTVGGLDNGTYYLREIKAPKGYNKLESDTEVIIEPTTTDGTTMNLDAVTARVVNNKGSKLPSTGGIGTTIFYVAGSILLLGAALLLILKKRKADAR